MAAWQPNVSIRTPLGTAPSNFDQV